MKLTFKNENFILIDGAKSAIVDFKAAVRNKAFADDRAGKIIARALVKRYPLPSEPLPLFLDPHQVDGVKWALTRSRSYLAHAPGAGKTCEAIVAALMTPGEGQVLFVVPPQLTVNWEREIAKFAPQLGILWPTVTIVPLSARQCDLAWRAEFIICPDSMLTKPWVLKALHARKIKFIAVDEASRFKEPSAQRTIALFGGTLNGLPTRGLILGTRHAVLLDGSPMPNRPMELWAPTYAMAPEAIGFMEQNEFGVRYCGATINDRGNWEYKHSSNEDELRARLQLFFMHVVPESALNHPERRRSLLVMNKDVRSVSQKSWEKKHLSGMDLGGIDEKMNQGDIAKYRRELGERKVPWVINYVGERLGNKNESILLFAWHRGVCQRLFDGLSKYEPGLVMGGTDPITRERLFHEFNFGSCRLIVGNIVAMGRGHNLQRADRVVFAEYSWTDELNKQCEKRASRRGNTKRFTRCDYIVCPNSMDEPILGSVFTKIGRVKRIIG